VAGKSAQPSLSLSCAATGARSARLLVTNFAMANCTSFQDLSDDLTCMVLEKLSRPGLKRAFEGMVALASVA
jgi:hypothetical protein